MADKINIEYLKSLFFPFDWKLDESQEFPTFWRRVEQNDTRSPFAFTIVMATLHEYSLRIEGMNEKRIAKAVRAGKIKIETEEEMDALREVLFETTLDETGRLGPTLGFLEQQLHILSNDPIHSDNYADALKNIKLIVDAANEVNLL